VVTEQAEVEAGPSCSALLEAAETDLAEAQRLHRLPDDYVDVSEGPLAPLKRRLKRKLLGNFKQAYVDVLARQQSAFNQQILSAVQELAECLATLDHVVHRPQTRRRGKKACGKKARDERQEGATQP
jgi:hypothetical protein